MSVLIRGMDMPTGNSTKAILIYSDGTVYTGHVDDSNYSAVKVKTPHGRLIDADNANEVMAFEMSGTGHQTRACSILKSDFYTPTVIEAEE